ncbi:MAG TPA: sugar-transfer associated ATP-grasp domain-containing protein [Dongiaceae bacterium]|nr:sugar-transfer associated ATP-grasp domain-containing protein [Dongiaceae bacterium]
MEASTVAARSVSELDLDEAHRRRQTLNGPIRVNRLNGLQAAKKAGAKNVISDLCRLTLQSRHLTVDEYFYYRLYEPHYSAEQRSRFVGKRIQAAIHSACNDPTWFASVDDKLLFYSIMRGTGFPTAETLALYTTKDRASFCPTLRDEPALRRFLAEPANYPLFLKPVDGMYSIGAFYLREPDGADILLKDGRQASFDAVVAFVQKYTEAGYLIQPALQPHPHLVESFGTTLPSIRYLVLLTDAGPHLESAVIKIPCAKNAADNYWRGGNMLGALNLDDGTIRRAVTGTGETLMEVESHPDIGHKLAGISLPDWRPATDLCLKAASMFPGIRTQSWDIALSAKGPIALEMNFGGDLNLHQLANGQGILSNNYIRHLRSCGYRGKLPAPIS